jgi:hypothetical protein
MKDYSYWGKKEETRDELFRRLTAKALSRFGKNDYCVVCDEVLFRYKETESSDFAAATKALESIEWASAFWQEFLKTKKLSVLHEVHYIPAVAIAIAIKVYICPNVTASFAFQTSKWEPEEGNFWWTISPDYPNGLGAYDEELFAGNWGFIP